MAEFQLGFYILYFLRYARNEKTRVFTLFTLILVLVSLFWVILKRTSRFRYHCGISACVSTMLVIAISMVGLWNLSESFECKDIDCFTNIRQLFWFQYFLTVGIGFYHYLLSLIFACSFMPIFAYSITKNTAYYDDGYDDA